MKHCSFAQYYCSQILIVTLFIYHTYSQGLAVPYHHLHSGLGQHRQRSPKLEGCTAVCQPSIKCAGYLVNENHGVISCALPGGNGTGLCCPTVLRNKEIASNHFMSKPTKDSNFELSTRFGADVQTRIDASIQKMRQGQKEDQAHEERLLRSKATVRVGSSSHGHLLFFMTSKRAIEISRFGYNMIQSSREISTRLGISKTETAESLPKFDLQDTSLKEECPAIPICNPPFINYRTIHGSCNNLKFPALGSSFTPLYRILTPHYADGIWVPRLAQDLSVLPSARALSSFFIPDQDSPDSRFSLFVMQFGQFIDHDLSHVPIYRFENGSGIECCTESGQFLQPDLTHPFCFPIEIPPDDPFYSSYGQRCMNFVRSAIAPRIDCSLGYADQMSQTTHWLDSSNVYGSTKEEEAELRLYRDGKLRAGPHYGNTHVQFGGFKGMLPLQEQDVDECTDPKEGKHCFNAGDLRVNEMIGLTATHIIWFREHNRLAGELKRLNPSWSDDQLFYEARRILNAEYQHILYNEWLPVIVGRNYMEVYGILPLSEGYSSDYDDRIDPSVANAFAAAAFRMGHTLIQGILRLVNEIGVIDGEIQIHNHFNRPFRIREYGILDKLIRTLTSQPIQSFDNFITTEVTRRLFQPVNGSFGMDLISLNIQRARDHGVPGYNFYRQICKLGRATSFSDFRDRIAFQTVELMRKFYNSVDDVDLFIGGISEFPLPGALLGPTFTCIIGDQFARSKKGDRFAFDLGGLAHSFTLPQLDQIRLASFARILCDNGDQIEYIQPLAFLLPNSNFNPILNCHSNLIPRPDITTWKH